ncbi:flagellar biosynthetic protein FliR [Chromatiaceae bacterium AAb-1]|nr:flagellar biosynthetic protein FliR [Chromatiaceae bacterium AAb-1]
MNSLISLTSAELMGWIGTVWWPFVRLSALLWALPVFDNPALPPRARILLAVFLSFLVGPALPAMPVVDPFSVDAIVMTLEQLAFGAIMGLAVRMLFEVLALAGLVLSMQMGLAMAMMFDPGSGASVSLLGQLFWIMAILLFFALNGHLVTLNVLVDSFRLWPVGSGLYELNLMVIVELFGWIFTAALLIALPAIIAMLLVSLTFGVATRSAPSLNIFVLGFPMTLLLGFFCVFMTVSQIGTMFSGLAIHVLTVMRQLMG